MASSSLFAVAAARQASSRRFKSSAVIDRRSHIRHYIETKELVFILLNICHSFLRLDIIFSHYFFVRQSMDACSDCSFHPITSSFHLAELVNHEEENQVGYRTIYAENAEIFAGGTEASQLMPEIAQA